MIRTLIIFLFLSFNAFAQNSESDLQKPVTDLGEMQKQEWEKIPTIYEVPIKDAPDESNDEDSIKSKKMKSKKLYQAKE